MNQYVKYKIIGYLALIHVLLSLIIPKLEFVQKIKLQIVEVHYLIKRIIVNLEMEQLKLKIYKVEVMIVFQVINLLNFNLDIF